MGSIIQHTTDQRTSTIRFKLYFCRCCGVSYLSHNAGNKNLTVTAFCGAFPFPSVYINNREVRL